MRCRVLRFDEDIRKHFSDGIHYMSLGKGATVETVVSEIASIMRATGANEIVDSVENSSFGEGSGGQKRRRGSEAEGVFSSLTICGRRWIILDTCTTYGSC